MIVLACKLKAYTMDKENLKAQIQADYEAIDNFNGDWVAPLIEKYKLSRDEILDLIEY